MTNPATTYKGAAVKTVQGSGSEDGEEAADEETSNAADEQTSEEADDDNDSDRSEDEGQKQVQRKETLRVQAMEGQQQQARRMNTARGKDFKEVLDIGDICLIRTDATIRAATDKVAICVKICTRCDHTPAQQVKSHITSTRFAQVRVT